MSPARALVLFLPQAKLTLASVEDLPKYNIGTLQKEIYGI